MVHTAVYLLGTPIYTGRLICELTNRSFCFVSFWFWFDLFWNLETLKWHLQKEKNLYSIKYSFKCTRQNVHKLALVFPVCMLCSSFSHVKMLGGFLQMSVWRSVQLHHNNGPMWQKMVEYKSQNDEFTLIRISASLKVSTL